MSKKKMREEEAAPAADQKKDQAADASDAGHDDAEQDKELIKKMLVKHLGEEPNAEVMKHAHEAYMAAKDSGMEHEAACETVGHAMKMAKIMHAHQAKAEEAKGKEEECKDAKDIVKEEKHEEKKEGEEHKESAADDVLKLRGEVASLKEALKKRELVDYTDKKLAETKLARTHTKLIRESLTACRSEAEVDQKIKLFLEGYKAGSEAGSGVIESAEKSEGVTAGVSFADCVL